MSISVGTQFPPTKLANQQLVSWVQNREWSLINGEAITYATGTNLIRHEGKNYSLLDLAEVLGAPEDIIRLFRLYNFPTTKEILLELEWEKQRERDYDNGYQVIAAAMRQDMKVLEELAADENVRMDRSINIDGVKADAMYFATIHKNAQMIRFLRDCGLPMTKAAEVVLSQTQKVRIRE